MTMKQVYTRIASCGAALPTRVVTNYDLEAIVDTTDAWIKERTGIETRYISSEAETSSYLGAQAALTALKQVGWRPTEIDFLICATSTPDFTFPATATLIQERIGMKQGFAFDVQAVCSGFVYALSVADAMIKAGHGQKALVIGADVCSKIVDWNDRNTCVLFGDGAGAVILERFESDEAQLSHGILDSTLYSDGAFVDLLKTSGGVGSSQERGVIVMKGREVYRHAVEKMTQCVQELLARNKVDTEDIKWLVPHQANKRIISAVASRLGLSEERIIVTVGMHANTSAASIPLALAHGVEKQLIHPGDLVVLEAFGGGLTWGSLLVRW